MPCQTFTNIWKKKPANLLPDNIFWNLFGDVKYVLLSTKKEWQKCDIGRVVREISCFSCFVSSKPWHAKNLARKNKLVC